MIRVEKTPQVPESLNRTRAYDGEDVRRQLLQDQQEKCYLCERLLSTNFQIEHLRSQEHNADDRQRWSNLFLSCDYCNGKKLHHYDDIVDPSQTNIELEIRQTLNYSTKKAVFSSRNQSYEIVRTIQLLEKLHNGQKAFRNIKEERFFEEILSTINEFLQLVKAYLETPSEETESAVRSTLSITKPALGFKYWIIKDNHALDAVFSDDIIWNQQ